MFWRTASRVVCTGLVLLASACASDAVPSSTAGAGSSGAGTARAGVGGGLASGGHAGSIPAQCTQTLQRSGCPVTYQAAIEPADCSSSPRSTLLSTCADRRVVSPEQVGGSTECIYDGAGALVGARSCSKTIGSCTCFYAGELRPEPCHSSGVVVCESDAGI